MPADSRNCKYAVVDASEYLHGVRVSDINGYSRSGTADPRSLECSTPLMYGLQSFGVS